MILTVIATDEQRISQNTLIGLIIMLCSFVALAESTDRLQISPGYYDDQLLDEIYDSADGWRKPPAFESEWRPEKKQQKSRIHIGYDSVHEELKARDSDGSLARGWDLGEPKPSTQFRIDF